MADKRIWAKTDVGYLTNPKIADVLVESHAAVILHLWSTLYSCQHLTDGLVSERLAIAAVSASTDDADMLVNARLWHRSGHDCEMCPIVPAGKVVVHDYTEHNRTAESVGKVSAKRSEAATARWNPKAEEDASHLESKHDASLMQNASGMQSNAYAEKRREEKRNTSSNSSMDFDLFWKSYPRKVGKAAAQKAFVKALKSTTVETIEGRWEDEPSGQLQIPTGSPWDPSFHRTQGAA